MIFLLAVCFGGFFCAQKSLAASTSSVQINEVAWMGTTVSYTKEWLELKNNTDQIIDLTGWSLKASSIAAPIALTGVVGANGFYLMERTSDDSVPGVPMDLKYTGDLANTGAKLELKDANGNVVDVVEATSAWPAGNNANKKTMERDNLGNWQDSKVVGGTPRAENSVIDSLKVIDGGEAAPVIINPVSLPEAATSSVALNHDTINLPQKISPQVGEVVINEIVSDPNDGEEEWIEIFINSNREFDVTNWTVEDGNQTKTLLSGNLSRSNNFMIIEKPKGTLNNTGDTIILRNDNGVLLDQLTYGNWNNSSDVAAPRDGMSLARIFDGVTSFNNSSDFAITEVPSKGGPNKIVRQISETNVVKKPQNYKDLIINEIMPNPQGDDANEWLEIYNLGAGQINLTDFRVGVADQYFKFATGTIGAGEFLVLKREQTHLSLPNTSATIKLYPPASQSASQSLNYSKVKESESFSRDNDGTWNWTLTPTPAAKNSFKKTNSEPDIVVYFDSPVEAGQLVLFDSSDTVDADGDSLSFLWQFGDGASSSLPSPQHSYAKSGNYKVKLEVNDGYSRTRFEKNIKITKSTISIFSQSLPMNNEIILNELMPNPEGTDDEEWIEVINKGKERINLVGWQLDDEEGGSSAFKIMDDVWLEPLEYAIFEKSETAISLNNNHDEVRLFNSAGQLVDSVAYQGAKEGLAFARNENDEWLWTNISTPGDKNVINFYGSESDGQTVKKKTTGKKTQKINNQEVVIGFVTSLPGKLSNQYFYMQNGGSGYQVYSFKKDFPNLEIGERIEVTGVMSEINNETRLKINGRAQIKGLSSKFEVKPQTVKCEILNDDLLSQLVSLEGEITKKTGASIYIDDETDEAIIYLRQSTGLLASDFKLGGKYLVTGILTKNKTGIRLLPRGIADIAEINSSNKTAVKIATMTEETLVSRPKNEKLNAYLSVIGGASALLVIGWFMRKKINF
ncbi:MAG: lamin tail domain-containing protein [bacterium]